MAKKRTAPETDGKVDETRLVALLKRLNRELEPMDSLWAAHADEIEDTLSAPHPMEGVSVGPWTSNCYANIVYLLGYDLHGTILASVAVEPVHGARWLEAINAKEFLPIATDVSHDDREYWGRISDAVFAWEATFSKADLHQLDIRLRNEWKRTGSIEAGRLAMALAVTLAFFKSVASAVPAATSGPPPGYLNVALDEVPRTITRVESDVAPIELLSFLKPLTTHQSADTSKNTEIVPTSRDTLTQDLLNYQFNERNNGKSVEVINREFFKKEQVAAGQKRR